MERNEARKHFKNLGLSYELLGSLGPGISELITMCNQNM